MDLQLQDLADRTIKYAGDKGIEYVDVRAENYEHESILIENGEIENTRINSDSGIGIKLAKHGSWYFTSITNPKNFDRIKELVDGTLRKSDNHLKNVENKINLKSNPPVKFDKSFPVSKKPDVEKLIDIGLECNKIILDMPKIIRSVINPKFSSNSKYFTNSEGSKIIQNFTDTTVDLVAIAHESGTTQSINITEGGRGGLEQITKNEKIYNSAKKISTRAAQLVNAKPVHEEETTVIMNPDFVSLLTHEILGHPSEADRVVGKEMAWAGGAWWKGKIGEKIGSDVLTVFDDPTIKESLGWYFYDDEGVKTQRTTLVENGILKNHMQSKETASIFDTEPTGNMRATNYRFMPLIRMACTCIKEGDWNPDEMIKEVKNGYFISNMKMPSIDMKRHNWSISCQYAQKIEKGEITDLHRDVIVTGTAQEFFESIDACGNDFTIRPITNCGKGDPMQSMIMGNGGPTIRGKATVKSVI